MEHQNDKQTIVIQQPASNFGRYGRLLLIALVICLFALVGMYGRYKEYFSEPGGPQERFHSLNADATKKIAILNISGTILDNDGFIKKQMDRIEKDPNVVAVVLRINSPGGTVSASDYLYHHLNELRQEKDLPMVVSMGGLCASGGYYLAMAVGDQEECIFAEPTTWTGSIGVVIPHYDLSGLLTSWEIKDDSIASHPYKLMGSPTRDLPPEEAEEQRELLQQLVDESFERFKQVVRTGRPSLAADDATLDKAATGQIFSSEQALALGLVDRIGFVEDAVERAAVMAGMETDQLRCVEYKSPPSAFEAIMGAHAQETSLMNRSHLQGLLELTAPRAYYLNSWLPNLIQNTKP